MIEGGIAKTEPSICMHMAGRTEAEAWSHAIQHGEHEVVLLPVEATKLYLDFRPFMNIAPLAVRSGNTAAVLTATASPIAACLSLIRRDSFHAADWWHIAIHGPDCPDSNF